MTRLRELHWALGFILAFTLHLAGYLWLAGVPIGPSAPDLERFRGGGTFGGTGDRDGTVASLLVSLGPSKAQPDQAVETAEAPRVEAPAPLPAVPEAPADATPEKTEETEAVAEPEPERPAPVPDATPDPKPARDPAAPQIEQPAPVSPPKTKAAAKTPPTPRRKPKAPPAPELGLLEDRLPVQGPAKTAPPAKPTPPAASPATGQQFELVQSSSEGRLGTASLNRDGQVPQLNYKEKVILWLKRYGGYPRDAYRYRQEGVVLLHFAIDRRGRVLYYNVRKSSGFHLLDQAVKQMMARASPVPPIPPDIPLEKMEFTVPVRFIRD